MTKTELRLRATITAALAACRNGEWALVDALLQDALVATQAEKDAAEKLALEQIREIAVELEQTGRNSDYGDVLGRDIREMCDKALLAARPQTETQ